MGSQSTPKPPGAKLLWLLWALTIAAIAGSVLSIGRPSPKATAFRQTAQGWKALPEPGTRARRLRISGGGVAWLQNPEGLSRLEGTRWHAFTAFDFGTSGGDLPGGFVLDGEEVWGAGSSGVIHFDGKRWQHYPGSLASGNVTSIAAARGQVWAIDSLGNLSHFDGHAWAVHKLDLPGVRWTSAEDDDPKLATASDGSLWLVFQGLWRYDGASWTPVPAVSSQAWLLGTTQAGSYTWKGKKTETRGGVWVFDGGKAVGFDVDGSRKMAYSMQDLGLLDAATLYAVAGRPPVFVIASSQGLTWFDGSQWHGEQIRSLGVATVSNVDVAPDGSIWGIGYRRFSFAYSRSKAIWALSTLFLLAIAVLYSIWFSARKDHYQREAAREAILHATGTLPEHLKKPDPSPAKTSAGVVAVLVLGIGGYWAVRRHWPGAPIWLLPVFVLGVHVIGIVADSLKKRKPLPSDPIEPGGPPRYDWGKSITPMLGSLAVLVLLYGGVIARHFNIRWLAAVPGVAFLFGGRFLFHGYEVFRGRQVEREIKQCRYGKALELLDGPLGWLATFRIKLLRVDALLLSGRAGEAEPILRELVESHRGTSGKTLAFEHLGRVLLALRRFGDARRAFEAAARLTPTRPAAYAGLAEVGLREASDPAAALADAARALELHRKSLLGRKTARERLASIRGNQAWALAALGRGAESQQALEAGAAEIDQQYKPEAAGFYWRAGMAMLALGNSTAAAGHFRRAVELDPQGYYGGLAAQPLRQHSVWGR